jgi:hypothetical protein
MDELRTGTVIAFSSDDYRRCVASGELEADFTGCVDQHKAEMTRFLRS